MTEDPPMLRHFNLIRLLASRRLGVTVRELSHELGVGEKTIRRDLEFLESLNVPLEDLVGERGRKAWRLGEGWRQPPLQFNFEEAAALYLGRRLLEPMAGTPFWPAANSAWRKIRSTLGEVVLNYLDRLPRVFHVREAGHGDYADKAAILEALTFAIEEHRATHIAYRSDRSTEPATRDVYPLSLVRHDGGALYLLAVAPEHDAVRTYKVDRIESADVSAISFQRYRDFDAAAFLERSLGIYDGDGDVTVVIRFHPTAARHAQERRWHASQEATPQRDGGLLLRLRLSSTVEIKSRVLSYGAAAVVLEPEDLRAEIAAELERMLRAYTGPPAAAAVPTAGRSYEPIRDDRADGSDRG